MTLMYFGCSPNDRFVEPLQMVVRMFIAAQGGGRTRFIEEAVRSYLLERAVEQAKAATAGMSEANVTDLIDEAVQWAREH